MTRFLAASLLAVIVFHASGAHADPLPRFRLHLEAEPGVRLQHHANVSDDGDWVTPFKAWDDVCAAPCDQLVDRHGVYRIGGEGRIPSDPLAIPPGDRIELVAQAGSIAQRNVGILLLSVASAALVGAAVSIEVAIAPRLPQSYSDPAVIPGPDTGWLIVSGALIAGTVAACAVGLPLLFSNRTRVALRGSSGPDLAAR